LPEITLVGEGRQGLRQRVPPQGRILGNLIVVAVRRRQLVVCTGNLLALAVDGNGAATAGAEINAEVEGGRSQRDPRA
jgi:hypothetical protein